MNPVTTAQRMIEVTEEDFWDGNVGACLACGELASSAIEPDARKYECDSCGAHEVYGLEELVLMERVTIAPD